MKLWILTSLMGAVIGSLALAQDQSVSIEQIAVAIENHIARESETSGGYFRLKHDEKELKLKLVRVHMEYLADLGGGGVDLILASGCYGDVRPGIGQSGGGVTAPVLAIAGDEGNFTTKIERA